VKWSLRLWGIVIVLGFALFLDTLDQSMTGVALPAIRLAFGMSTSTVQWIVSAYTLGYGGLLLLGGRTADLLGRRKVFLAAVAVFAVTSLFGGAVSSAPLLIGTRFVKGISAAFTAPASMSLLTSAFPEGPMRNRAFSVYTIFGASGLSLGLVFSGLLTEISWRLPLFVPAPAALTVLVAGLLLIPKQQPIDRTGRRFDFPGAIVITAAMLLLVYTIVSAEQAGWESPRTIVSFALVAIGLVAYVFIERRSPDSLMPKGIFRSGNLLRANLGAIVLSGTYISFQFLIMQYMQILVGWSPFVTGLAFAPGGVLTAALSTRMPKLLSLAGPSRLAAVGFGCLVLAYAWFLRVGVRPDYLVVMFPTLLLIGMAFGLGFSSLSIAATAGVRGTEQAVAASLFQTSLQVGGAVILAVVTAVVDAGGANKLTSAHAVLGAYRPALVIITATAALGLLVMVSGLRQANQAPGIVPVQRSHGSHRGCTKA
jgi:MFS family permease